MAPSGARAKLARPVDEGEVALARASGGGREEIAADESGDDDGVGERQRQLRQHQQLDAAPDLGERRHGNAEAAPGQADVGGRLHQARGVAGARSRPPASPARPESAAAASAGRAAPAPGCRAKACATSARCRAPPWRCRARAGGRPETDCGITRASQPMVPVAPKTQQDETEHDAGRRHLARADLARSPAPPRWPSSAARPWAGRRRGRWR